MADTIVVLVSSDDNEDEVKEKGKTSPSIANTKKRKRTSPQGNKRKMQRIDEEVATSKRMHTTYQEELATARKFADQRLPLMTTVETLATPSATPPLQLLASPPRNLNTVKDEKTIYDEEIGSPKSAEKTARRVKFTTLLKDGDDAWQEVRQKRLASLTSQQSVSQPSTPIPSEVVTTADDTALKPAMDLTNSTPSKLVPNNETHLEENSTMEIGEKEEEKDKGPLIEEKPPLEKEYEELLNECRRADPSPDMERLIETKLLRYYYSVHPDFVKSRGFRKSVSSTTERIRAEPGLVYYNLKTVVDELNVRRKSKDVVITNDETATGSGSNATSNKHTEEQIKKLNKALYILKKRIARLEETEVDWEDEDSSYLQVERFKKRACQIYEKICDLTGESKNARRLVKKPIQFSGTSYAPFNKTLQAYINRTKEFPDFFDVLRMLEHCNRQYDLKLASFEVKRIAQDAFIKVGKILQSRRKTDLYETVAHFTGNSTDPATADPTLLAKLKENEKTRTKISDVIEKYARAQDDPDAVAELQMENDKKRKSLESVEENGQFESGKKDNCSQSDDSDENEDEDDDDDENLDVHVEKLTQDNTVDISDVDTDTEINGDEFTEKDSKESNDVEEGSNSNNKRSISEDKIPQNQNHNVQLTVNNNIMRTKTNDSNLTIEETNGISTNTTTSEMDNDNDNANANVKHVITSLPEKSKSINTMRSSIIINQSCSEVISKSVKTTTSSPSKTASNPAKHRTIAEIVISDEE